MFSIVFNQHSQFTKLRHSEAVETKASESVARVNYVKLYKRYNLSEMFVPQNQVIAVLCVFLGVFLQASCWHAQTIFLSLISGFVLGGIKHLTAGLSKVKPLTVSIP